METDIIGLCARCLKSHAGKCAKAALALYIAAGPVYQSMHDGIPHDKLRPWIFAGSTATNSASLSAGFAFNMPNTMVPGQSFEAPAHYVWENVMRIAALQVVADNTDATKKVVFWVEPKKPDKA